MTRGDLYYDEYFECWKLSSKEIDEFENSVYNQALEDLSHELKETFNSEFPSNYHSTRPFYSLENVRILTEVVTEQLKK